MAIGKGASLLRFLLGCRRMKICHAVQFIDGGLAHSAEAARSWRPVLRWRPQRVTWRVLIEVLDFTGDLAIFVNAILDTFGY